MYVQFNHFDSDTAKKVTDTGKKYMEDMKSKFNGGLSKLLKTGYNTEIKGDIDYMSLYPWEDLNRK